MIPNLKVITLLSFQSLPGSVEFCYGFWRINLFNFLEYFVYFKLYCGDSTIADQGYYLINSA